MHDDGVDLAADERATDLAGERVKQPFVPEHRAIVDPDVGAVADPAELEPDQPVLPLGGDLHPPAIPGACATPPLRLPAAGHGNRLGERVRAAGQSCPREASLAGGEL